MSVFVRERGREIIQRLKKYWNYYLSLEIVKKIEPNKNKIRTGKKYSEVVRTTPV